MQRTIWKTAGLMVLVILILAGAAVAAPVIRGFRATTEPSRTEFVVARSLRDLAIPASDRRMRNPLPATAQNLQSGREEFRARCAGCHGYDGSGLTPVGSSLYPRVPDLRAALTQNLTDGQIHYVIENGVQLTGMPAWGNVYRRADDKSWNLVLFIRSLNPAGSAASVLQAQNISTAHYVGFPSQIYQIAHVP